MHTIGFSQLLRSDAEAGIARVRFVARPEFAHSNGTVVQGGLVTAWLDCAMAFAVNAKDAAAEDAEARRRRCSSATCSAATFSVAARSAASSSAAARSAALRSLAARFFSDAAAW